VVPEAITALNRALGADNAPHALWDLAERLGAPRSLAQLGLTDDDLTVAAGQTAAEAYPNPRTVTMGGALEVLRAAYAGRSPRPAALA
jgi:maleylacetate reductase